MTAQKGGSVGLCVLQREAFEPAVQGACRCGAWAELRERSLGAPHFPSLISDPGKCLSDQPALGKGTGKEKPGGGRGAPPARPHQ